MKELSAEEKNKLVTAIKSKIPQLHCPMCQNQNFILLDGYLSHSLQFGLKGIALGGTTIPTVALVCGNCGFLSQHSIGVLGLLPNEKKEPSSATGSERSEGGQNG